MKSVIRMLKQHAAKHAPNGLYFPWVNTKNAVRRRKHRIHPLDEKGLYQVDDDETCIVISERTRHSRYKRGIYWWVDFLATQYNLSQISVGAGGVFIDCGANVGELGLWARRKGLDYHAFEPERLEARCCDLNNFDGTARTNRMGLWFEATELKFYSKAASADSSFIEIAEYDHVTVLKTTTLDHYVEEQNIHTIEVLKVEAEGAEPEVLLGGKKALGICRYVTVDCGRERGIQREDTVRDVCNILYCHGFRMIGSDMERMSMLFENNAAAGRQAA